MQFAHSKLLLAAGVLVLGAVALGRFTESLTIAVETVTGLLFSVVFVFATGLRGRQQASAFAFSGIGTIYLMFIACASHLAICAAPTNYLIALAAQLIKVPVPVSTGYLDNASTYDIHTMVEYVYDIRTATTELSRFFLIGHCILSWIFAALAAWLAGLIYTANHAKES